MAAPAQLKGSFRGVPFGCFTHSLEGGRRTVTHEFPGRNDPYTEDLGQKARTFSLELFVLGDNVASNRDQLRAALEQKGPGILVHPWLGSLTVQVTSFTITEAYESQRLASFQVEFVQPGKLTFPKAQTNTSSTVSNSSTSASLVAGTNAVSINVKAPAPALAMSSLVAASTNLIVTQAKKAALPNSLALANDTIATIALMSTYVRDAQSIQQLIQTPDLMGFAIADQVFRLSGLGMTSLSAFSAYQRLLTNVQVLMASQRFPVSAIGNIMAANASLFQDVLFTAIVGSAAAAAIDADFTTYDQAIAARTALAAMFDVAMGQVTDDNLFGNLQDLRAQTLPNIPNPDASLPNVVKVQIPQAMPSLVLAYDLMGGSDDEQTIIDLNAVQNPWFVPNQIGQAVQILK